MNMPKDKDGMHIDRRRALTNDRGEEMKMVASEAGGKCKKHPEQEQLPGVCSACLRERLFQLYGCCKSQEDNKSTTVNMMLGMGVSSCSPSLSSSSPPYSSASFSTHISPNHHRRASEVSAKIAMVIAGAHAHALAHAHEGGLKKSRSIAVVPTGGGGGDRKTSTRSKKGGFWSKLLGSKSKGAAFMHSPSRGGRTSAAL